MLTSAPAVNLKYRDTFMSHLLLPTAKGTVLFVYQQLLLDKFSLLVSDNAIPGIQIIWKMFQSQDTRKSFVDKMIFVASRSGSDESITRMGWLHG